LGSKPVDATGCGVRRNSQLKGYTKDGKRIIGTYDLLPATALLAGRSADGELIYGGESQVIWDAAETQRVDGQIIFVDESYNHVPESEVEWKAS
jgi:hypothetical protein